MTMKITDDINYVGVNDRRTHLFEGLWPLPLGVSYNSYLITDEKTALIEPVDAHYFEPLLRQIRQAIGSRPLDYLVVDHMEPDHSGSIARLKQQYPDLRIVGNRQTLAMIKGFYGIEADNSVSVSDGDTLSLGQHTLRFYLTPMLHWPETMMTYDEQSETLFSGDAFGTFGALGGAIVDSEMDVEPFKSEMRRYYSNIVGKYGPQVQRTLQRLSPVSLNRICPTHGPVWIKNTAEVVALYDRLSRYEGRRGATVCYGSMYGNTEQLAEAIARGIAAEGVKTVRVHNLSKSHLSYVLSDIFDLNTVVLAAPTYNASLFPPMQALVEALKMRGVKNRRVAIAGSFTWASQALKQLKQAADELGWETIGTPVEMKQGFSDDYAVDAESLGHLVGQSIKAEQA